MTREQQIDEAVRREEALHARLVRRQSFAELRRKARKAARRQMIWTAEELDYGQRDGERLAAEFRRIASEHESR